MYANISLPLPEMWQKFDLFQRITDDPLKCCSYCGGRAQRVEATLPSSRPNFRRPRVVQKDRPPEKKSGEKGGPSKESDTEPAPLKRSEGNNEGIFRLSS
jgi:hypothetical protein